MKNNLALYDICYGDFIRISSEIDGIKKYLNSLNTFNDVDKYEYICAIYKLSDKIVNALYEHLIIRYGIDDVNIRNHLYDIHKNLTKLTNSIYSDHKYTIYDLIFILDSILTELTTVIHLHTLNNNDTIINKFNDTAKGDTNGSI